METMKTLNENYKRNVLILTENIRRGLTEIQARAIVDNFEKQFLDNNLYDDGAKQFIKDCNDVITEKFNTIKAKDLMTSLGVNVIHL